MSRICVYGNYLNRNSPSIRANQRERPPINKNILALHEIKVMYKKNESLFPIVCLFSISFEWACQDFLLLKADLGPFCMPHLGMEGPLV